MNDKEVEGQTHENSAACAVRRDGVVVEDEQVSERLRRDIRDAAASCPDLKIK
jgi:ferredoxin